ncbi:class I mannose-6-phosphate isomerase [Sphingomonas rubra]|uniref:Mannose-6-phosphate isomerase n=1 Tax=Sphingomonas rubra TaxID=634430 RepID=A0A1I5SB52_9SPHN|nr:class I mannose-6-phosphate isomerase [Sphingomonas rubra]SFP67506.1 mannose-6-phosphate isomerase [Sphingomonas rubra]
MPATKLKTTRVEKPWGRHDLFPGFPDQPADRDPIGEVWFQQPGDTKPDLLIKYLFPGQKLSVQVHPDDEQAHARGLPRGKDECWTILQATDDAAIAVGTKAPMSKEALRTAALDGSIEQDLHWQPVHAGDFMYCASGTIHAIGGGLTCIEVQQNSETTYRLYDYGSDRELHLDDGVEVANPVPYVPVAPPETVSDTRTIMVEGPKFVLERCKGGDRRVALPEGTTAWVVPITGGGEVAGLSFAAGECVTVTGSETIAAAEGADYLLAYAGKTRL